MTHKTLNAILTSSILDELPVLKRYVLHNLTKKELINNFCKMYFQLMNLRKHYRNRLVDIAFLKRQIKIFKIGKMRDR